MRRYRQADIEEVVREGYSSSLVAASCMMQLGGWKERLQIDETQDAYGHARWSVIRVTEDYVRRVTGTDADAEIVGTHLFVQAHGPKGRAAPIRNWTDHAITVASADLARFPSCDAVRAVYLRLVSAEGCGIPEGQP
jgi:hypothetical protein